MTIVQEPENAVNDDARWIPLRVSRINLLINVVGVVLACGLLLWVPLPPWLRAAVAVAFLAAFLWDLRLILLKGGQSVGAFYLYDIDAAPDGEQAAKVGIRVRYAVASALVGKREAEGTILKGAFVSPWFTAMRYALPQDAKWRKWWPHIIPLWKDSLEAESFRRVRVALKWK
jgi:hypothetical protein